MDDLVVLNVRSMTSRSQPNKQRLMRLAQVIHLSIRTKQRFEY
jgi:hypothetical protein